MKHLQKLLKETAVAGATAAGSVAGVRGSLFSKPVKRQKPNPAFKVQRIMFHNDARNLKESLLSSVLQEAEDGHFKAIDVVSKLKSAEKQYDFERDTIAFGVEDEDGNTVKIYVRANQAEQFEKTLAEILEDDLEDRKELPEVLFNLKDKFEIVHVEWGNVEEDEEEFNTPPEGEEGTDADDGSGLGDISFGDLEGEAGEGEDDFDLEGDDSSGVKSALDKVIAMLKADAEARTAEAKAKEAEANAKEAEFAARTSEARIKGEEETLDMEAYFKEKNDEKKEAQRLAKLARYRHEKAAELAADKDEFVGGSDESIEDETFVVGDLK